MVHGLRWEARRSNDFAGETRSTDNPVARSARYPFPPVAASGGIMTEVQDQKEGQETDEETRWIVCVNVNPTA